MHSVFNSCFAILWFTPHGTAMVGVSARVGSVGNKFRRHWKLHDNSFASLRLKFIRWSACTCLHLAASRFCLSGVFDGNFYEKLPIHACWDSPPHRLLQNNT
jgi:hypothetical protein